MKTITIVGARPEFIQTAPFTKAIRKRHTDILVHTGQHYDDNMSAVFFSDLGIPQPELNLGVGGGSHAEMTGQMLMKLEAAFQQEKPDWVVVFGDTNSTIAGALAAAKIHIPVAHIESGLRSYDRRMPEEVNRVMTDHLSSALFAPTQAAVDNLRKEGITRGVRLVGDVRVDVVEQTVPRARTRQSDLFTQTGLQAGEGFALATIHRASNTDDRARLSDIVNAFNTLDLPVVLPVHPRLKKMLAEFGLSFSGNVRPVEPLGFVDMVALLDACRMVITDSGGLQKEAYMLRRPCVTVRDTTEWIETVESGWNRLTEPGDFRAAAAAAAVPPPAEHPDFYGASGVCDRIVDALEELLPEARQAYGQA
ncbi:MAG: UDP-N-acetylglucosamine 2-epimerase (non-hydrolyzing) [Anaerolineae bacterium]|nr:UDP-N-acetylglucosamine 2-epimerase (non-hydrolyzing) [Anaerolineae bacterium]